MLLSSTSLSLVVVRAVVRGSFIVVRVALVLRASPAKLGRNLLPQCLHS